MVRSRRTFLTTSAVATLGLIAGCSSSEEMDGSDHSDGDDTTTTTTEVTTEPTNTPTMTETTTTTEPTTTTTPEGSAEVSIESSELQKRETSYDTEAYVLATIVNNGNQISGELSVKGRFYDEDDNLLDSTTESLPYLKPGETWSCYIKYLDDGEAVKSHKIDGEYDTEAPRMEIDGLNVTDTSMNKGSYDATITGTIENELEEDADYLAAVARFWKDDVILASGLDNITDVPAGENWSFEASYMGYGERWEDATDYDVIPELSIY